MASGDRPFLNGTSNVKKDVSNTYLDLHFNRVLDYRNVKIIIFWNDRERIRHLEHTKIWPPFSQISLDRYVLYHIKWNYFSLREMALAYTNSISNYTYVVAVADSLCVLFDISLNCFIQIIKAGLPTSCRFNFMSVVTAPVILALFIYSLITFFTNTRKLLLFPFAGILSEFTKKGIQFNLYTNRWE